MAQRLGKAERMRQILQVIRVNPGITVYNLLESPKRDSLYSYVSRYAKWGYIERLKPGVFKLTDKGESIYRRLTFGNPSCPLCGSKARRNGTRNGKQRWRCPKCGFHFTSGCEETLVKSLKKRGKAVFILFCEPWEANRVYLVLKDWVQVKMLEREFKTVNFVEV